MKHKKLLGGASKASRGGPRKGITPIIAVILLLMMTVAAAGSAFYWLIKIQSQTQGGTEQYEEQVFERLASGINWQGADYNRTHQILSMYLQNTGTTDIPIDNTSTNPTTSWILLDSEQTEVCSTKWAGLVNCISGCGTDLDQSEVRTVKLNLSNTSAGTCSITDRSNNSLFYVRVYFSGKATTAGTFEK